MGRPRSATITVATHERILDAALDAFADDGFDGARLHEIAARAGITRPSLLHHFASKELLYTATIGRAFGSLAAVLVQAMGEGNGYEGKLRGVVDGFCAFVNAEPRLARLLVRELVAGRGPGRILLIEQAVPLLDDVVAFIDRAHRDGRDAREARVPARAVLMAAISDALLRAATGELGPALWGRGGDATWTIVEATLVRRP